MVDTGRLLVINLTPGAQGILDAIRKRLDDVLVVRTRTLEVGAASCRIVQQAWRGETLLAESHVRAAFVAPDGRPRRQSAEWREAFRNIMNS